MKLILVRPVFINGWMSNYIVSTHGDVFRVKKDGKIKRMKQQIDSDGYFTVGLHMHGKSYFRRVNRLVASAFIVNPDPVTKIQVNHLDGDKSNNDYTNLVWATPKENIQHAWDNNLAHAQSGENHPNSKYTENIIRQVCELLVENKDTMRQISEKTKVSYTVVKQIRNHFLWNDISNDYNFDHYNVSGRYKKNREKK